MRPAAPRLDVRASEAVRQTFGATLQLRDGSESAESLACRQCRHCRFFSRKQTDSLRPKAETDAVPEYRGRPAEGARSRRYAILSHTSRRSMRPERAVEVFAGTGVVHQDVGPPQRLRGCRELLESRPPGREPIVCSRRALQLSVRIEPAPSVGPDTAFGPYRLVLVAARSLPPRNPDRALAPNGWGGYPSSDRGLAIGVACGGEAGDGRSFRSAVGCARG